MKIATLITAVLIAGCSSFDPEPYNVTRNPVKVQVVINPMLSVIDYKGDVASPAGTAQMVGDTCVITLKEYPIGLAHEMRHCLEGKWHPGASKQFPGNSDDIWQSGMLLRDVK